MYEPSSLQLPKGVLLVLVSPVGYVTPPTECWLQMKKTSGTSTCMPELALEHELLNEWDDPERVSLSLNFFNILQKLTEQQNLVERVRK